MVMYWNYIWLQTIIHSQKGWSRPGSHQVGSGGLKCGGVGGGDGRWVGGEPRGGGGGEFSGSVVDY